ncbi:hypothetical protein P9281_01700 [Caballeronia sp. LP003]|uniref:IS66 family transposase n=1 Tax=Caballeronia sp. LP003 TaxID=3038551 RepID=UPI002861BC11|nr:hypothetical protein [Caballeronia sp. LP003]MDR5785274.1 hypothetical protein [Caballeronia sp. LP003]
MVREIAARDAQIERLKAQIDKLRRTYFGSKSERLAQHIDKVEAQLEGLTAGRALPRREDAEIRRRRRRLVERPRESRCRRTCHATKSNLHRIRLAPSVPQRCSDSARMFPSNSRA